jgi:hypothetical protein
MMHSPKIRVKSTQISLGHKSRVRSKDIYKDDTVYPAATLCMCG